MASACSTWTGLASAAEVVVLEVRRDPGAVVVAWACQFAVEVAPVAAATSVRSAWDSSLASSSTRWAFVA